MSWRKRARCQGMNTSIFFVDNISEEMGLDPNAFPALIDRELKRRLGLAKEACNGCYVRTECLVDALRIPTGQDVDGYRAHTLPDDRRRIRKAGRTGKPTGCSTVYQLTIFFRQQFVK